MCFNWFFGSFLIGACFICIKFVTIKVKGSIFTCCGKYLLGLGVPLFMSCNIDQAVMRQLQEALSVPSYEGLVADFCRNGRQKIETIQGGFDARDAKAISEAARYIKSSSGTIGLVTLSKTASKLEASANLYLDNKDDDFEAMKDILELVVAFYDEGETFMLGTLECDVESGKIAG